jgi:catalase
MSTKKPNDSQAGKPKAGNQADGKAKSADAAATSSRSTVSGPSGKSHSRLEDAYMKKMDDTNSLVESFPSNTNKPNEYGSASASPREGATSEPASPNVTASTMTEGVASAKVGEGKPNLGYNPANESLDRVRTDASGQVLTTNQGVPVGDNQHSLKAGLRGPALLEDFILREKITHFDHERIPERIVHARGSAAHGYFECYEDFGKLTRASVFAEKGKRTPVFVRFSTVIGERGSPDTVRDVRGFAVKFYTDQGNWDLVGNNIPVFFIQDAMKFPDLVHAAKPEPHFAMPQASTAHDTFWDFVSLMPESTHMLMWAMSDRGIPRSYRMMEGFGVHTFRLVNDEGQSTFVKFHWRPLAGVHSLDWDEAVKIAGADADYHRRDLWESIEGGNFPEYELYFQTFTEAQAEQFSFDILDATKLIPEELIPLRKVGKMVLNRNPDNFFAETEQVAFCTAHVVPGIDFSNDPLLAGRIHSYVDTQISRLGGPNFHEIPINAPAAQVHNNQRDGMHRQSINRGRVAYEPNSLGGGCPFQAGAAGFTSYREPIQGDKVRGNPERFAEHYLQAKLFLDSQTEIEKAHILRAFRFELTRVQVPAIRQRMVSSLRNVDESFAKDLADELGIPLPPAMPRAIAKVPKAEITSAPSLSILSHPGDGNIRSRKIAILVANGSDVKAAQRIHAGLTDKGAVPRYIGPRLGSIKGSDGSVLDVEGTLETMPSVLFDAVAVPGGKDAIKTLSNLAHAMEFLKDQYRHAKPILGLSEGVELLEKADIKATLASGAKDPGVLMDKKTSADQIMESFAAAIAKHRHHEREQDPPPV